MQAGTALLGSLTIPGRPENVRAARAFVAQVLADDCACTPTAVLLTCELVTNSLLHSDSRLDGGIITVTLMAIPGGIRAEVIDEGGATVPTLRPGHPGLPELAEGGRGLQLVEMLSARWSYIRDETRTVTWFELAERAMSADWTPSPAAGRAADEMGEVPDRAAGTGEARPSPAAAVAAGKPSSALPRRTRGLPLGVRPNRMTRPPGPEILRRVLDGLNRL